MFEKVNLQKVIEKAENLLNATKKLTNFSLLEICKEQRIEIIGSESEGHLAHEIMEVAVNNCISNQFSDGFEVKSQSNIEILGKLRGLKDKIPPQSWRSSQQIRLQQFSTPPQIAFLMAKILEPTADELILEPSAGTGSLATWLRVAGCKIHVNEISATRRTLLELQNYQPTGINAEFLDDLLPEKLVPEGILMNPPFSSTGGRCKKTDSNFGFRHVKSALARLKEGGRLVALLGGDTITKTTKGRIFLSEIADEYDLKAVITLPKNAFYKYGTNFQTCIVCIKKPEILTDEKRMHKSQNVLEANCRNIEECLGFTDIFDE